MVAIFPKLCLWRGSLCSNLGGIDPEKLYRATLKMTEKIILENAFDQKKKKPALNLTLG